jgi:hypothetical protein
MKMKVSMATHHPGGRPALLFLELGYLTVDVAQLQCKASE